MGRFLRFVFCSGLLVAVTLLLAGCAGSQPAVPPSGSAGKAADGPRLAVSEEFFDFGKVPLNKVVNHTFQLKNVGTAPLVLAGAPTVRAAQGC